MNKKPEQYETVLLRLRGDDYTTGWWSGSEWVGLSFNQSPPTYRIEDDSVLDWQQIVPVRVLDELVASWREYANGWYCQNYNKNMADGLEKAAFELMATVNAQKGRTK